MRRRLVAGEEVGTGERRSRRQAGARSGEARPHYGRRHGVAAVRVVNPARELHKGPPVARGGPDYSAILEAWRSFVKVDGGRGFILRCCFEYAKEACSAGSDGLDAYGSAGRGLRGAMNGT